MSEQDVRTTDKLAQLLSYAPGYYESSELYRALMQASAAESLALRDALEDVMKQFFVDTATWGLAYWEAELGLIINESLSHEARRAAVLQKMRGTGTLTPEQMAAILQSFGPARAEIDRSRLGEYHFDAWLIDFLLSPKRPKEDVSQSIRMAIEAAKPAHLKYKVNYGETILEGYREWYKKQTGKEFAHSDKPYGFDVQQQNAELKYGSTNAGRFRLGVSGLGAGDQLGEGSLLRDQNTHWFGLKQQEMAVLQSNELQAFRANASRVNEAQVLYVPVSNVANWEYEQARSEQMRAGADQSQAQVETVRGETFAMPSADLVGGIEQMRSLQEERVLTAVNLPQAFRFNVSPLNLSPLLHVSVPHAATIVGTLAAVEAVEPVRDRPQTEAVMPLRELAYGFLEDGSFRLGTSKLNTMLTRMRYADGVSCVLYKTGPDGTETVVEQRAL